ncbi:hypothetical protein ALP75_205085 [Pseudomonas syringae pv. actinidiae]|nr:hypothetical protein ALP75_205085 [Pseudomonas syringae pv. actinidiae]
MFEPRLKGIGNLLRRANKVAARQGEAQGDFSQAQAFVSGQLLDPVRTAFLAVGTQIAQFREWLVQWVLAEIMVIERATKGDDGVFDSDQFNSLPVAAFHFSLIAADDRTNARQNR